MTEVPTEEDSSRQDRVPDLIAAALVAAPDSDERAVYIRALHFHRAHDEVFAGARELVLSPDPDQREVGVDILGSVGLERTSEDRINLARRSSDLTDSIIELLLKVMRSETVPRVLEALGFAFGHLDDPRPVDALVAQRRHPDENVRYAVVYGLLMHDVDSAVSALIELSRDPDSHVRDWATFGLGSQIERDTPAVRAALAARLSDEDEDTREEAICGLAARGDDRAVRPMLELLNEGCEGPALNEALYRLAAQVRHPDLCRHAGMHWRRAHAPGATFDPLRNTDHEYLLDAARNCGFSGAELKTHSG
ncbi:MAG: HEAT repeat domain-containing protein [Solirubrobacteraceae bacterium]